MRRAHVVAAAGLLLFATGAQADCSVRCRPNLFFKERTDCYTDFRIMGGTALPSSGVMEASGNWAGMTPAQLKTDAELKGGLFGCIQAAGSPRLLSLFIEMSGFSRPLVARGINLGDSTAWDLGVGLEVGGFVTDWVWIYGQVAGLMGIRDFTTSGNVPEQKDMLGSVVPANGSNSGFGYKASLGVDLRITGNAFLNLSWHYRPSQETYADATVSTVKGFKLDATSSVVAAGISWHAD
jgi:opacity protein-like surface antigen